MKTKIGILFFGIAEILIGGITLLAVFSSLIAGRSDKPAEVLAFVIITGAISFCLGVGILKRSLHSYHMLLFFAAVVILSKILIFAKIISLTGELETSLPPNLKNTVSIIYHALLIIYFSRPAVKKEFGKAEDDPFIFKAPFTK